MNKSDLLFDWQGAESHTGYKMIAFVFVAIVFGASFGLVNVKLDGVHSPAIRTADIFYFSDDAHGRHWRMIAEEAGPFPGRLEVPGVGLLGDFAGFSDVVPENSLNRYEVSLVPFQEETAAENSDFAVQKGRRYFPVRSVEKPTKEVAVAAGGLVKRTPILAPYDSETLGWLPDSLPVFDLDLKDELFSASWRFVLSLREDGSVAQCVALSGSDGEDADAMCDWLSRIRFQPGDEERWMGLRVEFVNQ